MSELFDKQTRFFELICRWGLAVYARGYRCTFGDAYWDPRSTRSYSDVGLAGLHDDRLALDVNLFLNGKYLTTHEEWEECGRLWETLDPRCSWGGDFKDPNHLSFGEGKGHDLPLVSV